MSRQTNWNIYHNTLCHSWGKLTLVEDIIQSRLCAAKQPSSPWLQPTTAHSVQIKWGQIRWDERTNTAWVNLSRVEWYVNRQLSTWRVYTGVDADKNSSNHQKFGRLCNYTGTGSSGTQQCEDLTQHCRPLPTSEWNKLIPIRSLSLVHAGWVGPSAGAHPSPVSAGCSRQPDTSYYAARPPMRGWCDAWCDACVCPRFRRYLVILLGDRGTWV